MTTSDLMEIPSRRLHSVSWVPFAMSMYLLHLQLTQNLL